MLEKGYCLTYINLPISTLSPVLRLSGRPGWLGPGCRGPPRKSPRKGGPLPLWESPGPQSSGSVPRDLRAEEGDPGGVEHTAGTQSGRLQRGEALQVSCRPHLPGAAEPHPRKAFTQSAYPFASCSRHNMFFITVFPF